MDSAGRHLGRPAIHSVTGATRGRHHRLIGIFDSEAARMLGRWEILEGLKERRNSRLCGVDEVMNQS
jgi:hypothetical protein